MTSQYRQREYTDPEFTTIKCDNLTDVAPVIERTIERALAYCLVSMPGETIKIIVTRGIDLHFTPEVKTLWEKIKPLIPGIAETGNCEASKKIKSMIADDDFWTFEKAFSNFELMICEENLFKFEVITAEELLDYLIAIRALRKSTRYITQHKLLERLFNGWSDL